jgi:predicted ATPase
MMSNQLDSIEINNFRSLVNLRIKTNSLNLFFGPNGAGKSSLLDTIWFIRDCAIRGVDLASSDRDHGIGLLWDGAEERENISIAIETDSSKYEVLFGYSAGRIEPFVGESLYSKEKNICLIDRKIGSKQVDFYQLNSGQLVSKLLKEPEKLALTSYVALEESDRAASDIDNLLRNVRFYNSRSASLYKIKRFGSESDYGERLQDRGDNLWSVLRNLHDVREIDERYNTIVQFMKESFPSFKGIFIKQTGPRSVYGHFVEINRRQPIFASGVSDGYIQMLLNLTALFSEGDNRALILFDEPEISLHPWALAVFAKAVKLATEQWNKQVFIATHSPVLISQFESENILTAEIDELGRTEIKRVNEIEDIQDLIEAYDTGSLYMAEMVAAQSKSKFEESRK